MEAFVLSRVDGHASVEEIALTTGLEQATVDAALARLREIGAIRLGEVAPPPRPTAPPPRPPNEPEAASERPRRSLPAIEQLDPRTLARHPSAALYDPAELDEDCDLDLARRREILDRFYELELRDHYALLGVPRDADKAAIKAAYFAVVARFHPDKHFGKRLGSFKPKLERVFARVTEAHDALTRKRTRQEYDEYLRTKERTRAFDRLLRDEAQHAEELELARQRILAEARSLEHAERAPPPPAAPAEPLDDGPDERTTPSPAPPLPEAAATNTAAPFAPPPVPNLAGDGSSPRPPVNPLQRRRALARKLGGASVPPPPPEAVSPAPPPPEVSARRTADDLRRLYTSRVSRTRDQHVDQYVTAAETALREKNTISATNALRIAISLAPEREDLVRRLAELEQQARVEMADGFLEQARYEEQEQHWEAAARSYHRASLGKPTARIHERAAYCLLAAGGDPKQALEHARAAVSLAPTLASHRVTLARVYLAAAMRQSALAELERAQSLAPQDDTIKDWLKRIRRNQI